LQFDEAILLGKSPRERSEIETDRDLVKPIEQLLCDFHEEAESNLDKYPVQSMIRAHKRMVSMMAKVALSNEAVQKSNDALQRRVHQLSWVAVISAVLSALIGLVALFR
jgi:hypothetical protein